MPECKYNTKLRLHFLQARADASKLESEIAVIFEFEMLVALNCPIGRASNIILLCFKTTPVAISGVLVSLKVMYGRVDSKRENWSDCNGSKHPPKVRQCAIVDSMGDRRSAVAKNASTTWKTKLEAHGTLERKKMTKAKVLTAISRGKPPNFLQEGEK